jgi:hypothetical protein
VLVQRNGGVVFVSLTGRRLARVPGADLSSATQAPGRTTLEVDGALYALRTDLGALMPIPNGGPPVADDRRVPLPRPRMSDGRRLAGHWRFARLATDGNHILAQWSGECEVPLAYIIALQDGEPIPVTGAEEPPPESFALGWTRRSQAIVLLPNGACASSSGRPGVYAFSAPGVSRFITWVPDRIALARMWGAVGQPLPA